MSSSGVTGLMHAAQCHDVVPLSKATNASASRPQPGLMQIGLSTDFFLGIEIGLGLLFGYGYTLRSFRATSFHACA